jgi:SRSO17 transposase
VCRARARSRSRPSTATCRSAAGVPEDVEFKTKPQIALEQIKWACEVGWPRGMVIVDAGYGVEAEFRNEISALKSPRVSPASGSVPRTIDLRRKMFRRNGC